MGGGLAEWSLVVVHRYRSYMKEEQVKEIENCILDRCAPHGGVVHILVDRMSTYVSDIVCVVISILAWYTS